MAGSVSEQVAELSAELLLRAAGDLAQIAYNAGMLVTSVGNEALVALINSVSKDKLPAKDEKALKKIREAVQEKGETPRQVTILENDRDVMEKWLKKQDVLYAVVRSEEQNAMPGFEKSVVVFLEKDAEPVNTAIALTQHERGYINELPPSAFLFTHQKKDFAVVNNLDTFELEIFRELAKEHGLVYSALLNPADSEEGKDTSSTYKILVSKKDFLKAAAVMQMVSWSLTGEHRHDIKEKIKVLYSIKHEIQQIVAKGVTPGKVTVQSKFGQDLSVENAKYIVNKSAPHQYLKITSSGFSHFKFGEEVETVSKDDSEYNDKIQFALGEFSGAVTFDASEWEREGLEKANTRKQAVKQKLSVFPPNFNKNKEAGDVQKARKHRKQHDPIQETAWLFDKYDTQKPFSEVYELNYNDASEPPEKTVSVHYNDAVAHSEKFTYVDVSIDEKSIDNIIAVAQEKVRNNDSRDMETEIAR